MTHLIDTATSRSHARHRVARRVVARVLTVAAVSVVSVVPAAARTSASPADVSPTNPRDAASTDQTDPTDQAGGSAFVPVEPCRRFDSRELGTRISARATTPIHVGGRCGTPAGATAAAVTITVTDPAAPGFLTAWGGGDRPASSNVNFRAGETVANSSIVPLDDDGVLRLVVDARSHVIVDVVGVFVPAATSRSGRFVPLPPARATDTRALGGPLLAGDTHHVGLPAGVPPDATAITGTVTVIEAARPGFAAAHAAGTPRPPTSIANLVAGQTRAASAILPVSSEGLAVHADSGGHVVLDVTGYFTGGSAEESADGLFVPTAPTRLHDSRSPRRTLAGGGAREVDVPTDAAAWAVNITATDARAPGFATVYPARTAQPDTSVVNVTGADAVSNSAIVPVSTSGLAVGSDTALDVIVDGTGWFTGTPLEPTTTAAPDPIAPARVLVVGDSAAAGMRWNGALPALRGAEFTTDLESCRRLVVPSCNGREGRTPSTALQAVERHPFGQFDVLVVATGYNDVASGLGTAIDRIVPAARARGMRTVLWLTYREDVGYRIPSGASTSYPQMNRVLRERADETGIVVLDWWEYTDEAPHWFASDGVHQTLRGSVGQADAISRALAAVEQRTCPMPWRAGDDPERPCPTPDALPDERSGVPDVAELYPELFDPAVTTAP